MAGKQQVNKHTLAQAVRGKDCQVPLVSLVSNQNGSWGAALLDAAGCSS